MEAHSESEPRFVREARQPLLAEAGSPSPVELLPEPSDLLSRLERYAEESGRLLGRIDALEQGVRAQRESRRRLTETLKRERVAAKALAERAERAETAEAAASADNERLRRAVATSEQALEAAWSHIADVEGELAWAQRPAWRKLLRRSPK